MVTETSECVDPGVGLLLTLGQDAQAEQRFDMLRLLGNDLLIRLFRLSELVGLLEQNAQA